LSEVGADPAARLNPGPQPARLEGYRANRLRHVSELHRPRWNRASHRKAGKAQFQARGNLAGLQTGQGKVVVERPRSSAAAHHRLQPLQVRVSVVAAQSADNLARRLRVLLPVKDKAAKCVGNPESIDR
jgi:hypothetical protein